MNQHAKGRAAETAEKESYSYTRATKALLYFTARLSLTRCIYLPPPHPARGSHPSPSLLGCLDLVLHLPFLSMLCPLGMSLSKHCLLRVSQFIWNHYHNFRVSDDLKGRQNKMKNKVKNNPCSSAQKLTYTHPNFGALNYYCIILQHSFLGAK